MENPASVHVNDVFSLTEVRQNPHFSPSDNIVLLTFDDNYLDQSINLILSIAHHNPQKVSFLCICPQLKQESIDTLMALDQGIQVRCYSFALDFQMGRWVLSAVLRVFCPWLLDDEIKQVLYMDSDILCTGSLQPLFDAKIPCIGMCNEVSGNVSKTQIRTVRPHLPTQIYCNSGVMIFNLDYLRQHHTFHEIFTALSSFSGKVVFLDQDFFNIYFSGRISVINAFQYNFQPYELRHTSFYKEALRECRLIHYSVGKPWNWKTPLWHINLYLKHSRYLPMTNRVQKIWWKSLCYSPIRLARRTLSPVKQAILSKKQVKNSK